MKRASNAAWLKSRHWKSRRFFSQPEIDYSRSKQLYKGEPVIAYYLLATTNATIYGFAVPKKYLEFKVKFLKENPGFPLYHEHDDTKPPVGRILNAELVWREDIKAHAIEAEVELFETNENIDPRDLLKNGMSMAFSDRTFLFGTDKDQADLEFSYDAYRTDETKLEKTSKHFRTL